MWYIEGDIQKCFYSVDHDMLMLILKNKIADKKFLQLIGSGLKARVLLPKGKLTKTELGVPQGGIASPLLSNVYLHELDKFLLRLKRIIDRGKRRRENPEYRKYSNRYLPSPAFR